MRSHSHLDHVLYWLAMLQGGAFQVLSIAFGQGGMLGHSVRVQNLNKPPE